MYNLQKIVVDLMKKGYTLKEITSQVNEIYRNALPMFALDLMKYNVGDKFFVEPYLHDSPQVDEANAYGTYEIIEKIGDDHFLARHKETGEIFATNSETITYLSTGLIYRYIYVGLWNYEDKEYRFINI